MKHTAHISLKNHKEWYFKDGKWSTRLIFARLQRIWMNRACSSHSAWLCISAFMRSEVDMLVKLQTETSEQSLNEAEASRTSLRPVSVLVWRQDYAVRLRCWLMSSWAGEDYGYFWGDGDTPSAVADTHMNVNCYKHTLWMNNSLSCPRETHTCNDKTPVMLLFVIFCSFGENVRKTFKRLTYIAFMIYTSLVNTFMQNKSYFRCVMYYKTLENYSIKTIFFL